MDVPNPGSREAISMSEHITRDLMRKASDDVEAALRRVLSIAPSPWMPIAASAGAACIGALAAELEHTGKGRKVGDAPDPECVLLAGLLCAHFGLGGDDPIGAAYADLKTLLATRTTPIPNTEA